MTHTEKSSYGGWANAYRLYNDAAELWVTADVGPRVIRFGFVGEENEFREVEAHMGKTGGDEWRAYGGHRLWHAPEHPTRTYIPDNEPVAIKATPTGLHIMQPTEKETGIQKEIIISLDAAHAQVHVLHKLHNRGLWSVELAPWALSVMAAGGKGILPLPPKGSHRENLLPVTNLVLWAYTDMADARWTWGSKYILLQQDNRAEIPQKIGMPNPAGWAAYVRNNHLFIKLYQHQTHARYPDMGCSTEMFTNNVMLEVESLGPLTTLAPGAVVEHEEHWFLFRDVPLPQSDADVDHSVLPCVAQAKARIGMT